MPTLTLHPIALVVDGHRREGWRVRVEDAGELHFTWDAPVPLREAAEVGLKYLEAFEEERRAEEREGTDAGTESPAEREGVAQGEDAAAPPGEAAPDGPALKLLGNDDGGNGQPGADPAADVTGTPGREPDMEQRAACAKAGITRLGLTTYQAAAVLQQALGLPIKREQTLGHHKEGKDQLVLGMLTLGRSEAEFDGAPFWLVAAHVRYRSEKSAKLAGGGKARKRQAWCHALAGMLLDGAGRWEDTLWLGDDKRVLHVARPLHDDEARHLRGAWPEADDLPLFGRDEAEWRTEPARSYRSMIALAGEHEMPPERRK